MEQSPFALLPQELRDHIYNFTFTTSYAMTLQTDGIQHPLTQTCRQLRQETLALYLNLTRFNAHLDDGPATPLALWLQTVGPEQCRLLREVNIWDMHMLNGSLHGERATARILAAGIKENHVNTSQPHNKDDDAGDDASCKSTPLYVLKPVGRDIFHGSWYLADIVLALQNIGLGLQRFCEMHEDGQVLKQTSHFAIQTAAVIDDTGLGLVGQFGLTDRERSNATAQLDAGNRLIQLHEGRRTITLAFNESRRLAAMRQRFIPRDEEFYM